MTLDELRATVEKDFCTDLIHQDNRTGNVYVMCDDQSVNYIIKVIRYSLNDANEWVAEILFNDVDYVCACDVFSKCLNTEYVDPLKGLEFTCPECGKHRLEVCQDGYHKSEVFRIDEQGDHDYGDLESHGEVLRYQCLYCGHTIESRYSGFDINDNVELAEEIMEMNKDEESK